MRNGHLLASVCTAPLIQADDSRTSVIDSRIPLKLMALLSCGLLFVYFTAIHTNSSDTKCINNLPHYIPPSSCINNLPHCVPPSSSDAMFKQSSSLYSSQFI